MVIWNNVFSQFPWSEIDRLGKLVGEMNELFDSPSRQASTLTKDFPVTNMWGNQEELIITSEVPGIDPKELNINVLEDMLFIQGKRNYEEASEKISYHRQERKLGEFKRVFRLPFKVETEKVDAKYEKGVLKITLPRSEKEKPKQITVSTS